MNPGWTVKEELTVLPVGLEAGVRNRPEELCTLKHSV